MTYFKSSFVVAGLLFFALSGDSVEAFSPAVPFASPRQQTTAVSPLFAAPTINDKFPNLVGSTQDSNNFDLYEYLGDDSWAMIFMHPGDFTPVCTTELGTAAKYADELKSRNVKLVGFSCNDAASHRDWIKDIASVTGGQVDFPMFCDPGRDNAVKLGILDENNKDAQGLPLTVRSLYILKPDKTIALMMTYPASTGRNFKEVLRVLDSVQMTAEHSVATPVDWKRGEDVIVNFPLSNKDADEKFGKKGYRVVSVPSEQGKDGLAKNYLRYTKDPSASVVKRWWRKLPLLGRV